MAGRDPLAAGTLTKAEMDRCTNDPKARLGRFKPPLRRPDSFAAALNAIADGLAVVPPADVETARSAAKRKQRKAQLTDRGICPICRVYVGKGVVSHAAVCRGRIASDLSEGHDVPLFWPHHPGNRFSKRKRRPEGRPVEPPRMLKSAAAGTDLTEGEPRSPERDTAA